MFKTLRTASSRLLLGLGLCLTLNSPVPANNLSNPQTEQVLPTFNKVKVKQTPPTSSPLADGVYHYGQANKLDQSGVTYLVFEVHQGKVHGALYQLNSEYSCFNGTVEAQRLNLQVLEPYEGEPYSYSIALREQAQMASGGQIIRVLGLEGYYPLEQGHELEVNLLEACGRDR